jgi:hypothetical protein
MLLLLLLMTSMNESCNRSSRVGTDLCIIFSSAFRPPNLSFVETLLVCVLVCSADTLSSVTCVDLDVCPTNLNSNSSCRFPVYFNLDLPFLLVSLVDHWWCLLLSCVFYGSSL